MYHTCITIASTCVNPCHLVSLQDWRDLARKLGLDKYIQLLESRSPHSTRLLLLKWGEKPRWTVDSLLYTLRGIGREDVVNFIRARMNLPKK